MRRFSPEIICPGNSRSIKNGPIGFMPLKKKPSMRIESSKPFHTHDGFPFKGTALSDQ